MLLPETPAAAGTGGQVRIYHFVKAATQVSDVTLAILAEPHSGDVPKELDVKHVIRPQVASSPFAANAGPLGALKLLLSRVLQNGRSVMLAGQNICVDRSRSGRQSWFHKIYGRLLLLRVALAHRFNRLFPTDVHVLGGCWDQIQKDLDELQQPPDIVWYEHSYLFPLTSKLSKRFPEARVIVNSHNVEWLLKDSIANTKTAGLARKWIQLESQLLKQWETQMVQQSTLIYACSPEDRERLMALKPESSTPIEVIPNGVDVNYFQAVGKNAEEPTLLFAGTAGYPPNDDAVQWLTAEIFPAIRKNIPQCQLLLAGRNADQHWGHLHSDDAGIEVASNVPDMRPLLARAWVSLVPLRSGSGTRLKIVEAMSSGRCVVSTTIGAEGLDLKSETDLILRDSAGDFTEAVISILNDPDRRRSFETRARQVACDRFDWQFLAENAADTFRNVVQSEHLESVN